MEKDMTKKRCLSDNSRYADLINGTVFGGKELLRPEDLSELDSQTVISVSKARSRSKKRYRQQYQDLVKKAAFGVNFAVIGVEDQEDVHYLMPVRTMSYDAAQYQRQADRMKKEEKRKPGITRAEFLSGFHKTSRLHPCVTFVLFFGERWDGSRELRELLDMTDIPEELQPYINNYSIHVIEVRRLEDTSVFRTDLKQIFDFIRCSDDKENLRSLIQNDPAFQEMDEAAYEMMAEYGHAKELLGLKKYRGKDGKVNMCKGIQGMLEDSRAEGLSQGEYMKLIKQVQLKLDKGKDVEKIAEELEEPAENVERIRAEIVRCGLKASVEVIYAGLQSQGL